LIRERNRKILKTQNSAETKLSRERNRKILKTQNSAGLIELSIDLIELSADFLKTRLFFKNVLAHSEEHTPGPRFLLAGAG
jgi:hypothetical protein